MRGSSSFHQYQTLWHSESSTRQLILSDRINAGDLLRASAAYRTARILNLSDLSVSIAIPGVLMTSCLRLEFALQPGDDKFPAALFHPRLHSRNI